MLRDGRTHGRLPSRSTHTTNLSLQFATQESKQNKFNFLARGHPHTPCKTPGGVAEVHPHSKQMGERRSANGLAPPLEGKPAEITHECVVPRKQA